MIKHSEKMYITQKPRRFHENSNNEIRNPKQIQLSKIKRGLLFEWMHFT